MQNFLNKGGEKVDLAHSLEFNPKNWLNTLLKETQQQLKAAQVEGDKLENQKEMYIYIIELMKNLPNHHVDALEEEQKSFQVERENIKKEIIVNEELQVKLSTKLTALRALAEKMQ